MLITIFHFILLCNWIFRFILSIFLILKTVMHQIFLQAVQSFTSHALSLLEMMNMVWESVARFCCVVYLGGGGGAPFIH